MRIWVLALSTWLIACAGVHAATYSVSDGGRTLTARTARLEARFRGADVAFLKNLVTGEVYTRENPYLDPCLARISVQDRGNAEPGPGEWRTDGQGAVLRAGPYTMRVSAADGRLVLHCEGALDTGGVCGISWGITNLDLNATSAVLPVKGGRVLSAESGACAEEFEYPTHWEAQLAIVAGKKGAASIYSTDRGCNFKRLRCLRAGDGYQLTFGTDNPAPFADLKRAESVEWRLDCFAGDWRAAAAAYKAEMREAGTGFYSRHPVAAGQRWPERIRASVRIGGDCSDTRILDEIARRLDPAKTLLYLPDWRKDDYDVNYPDYTGKPGLAAFTKHAQKLGFRVVFHVDLPGVTPSHPAFELVKQYQVKDSKSLEPVGWMWDKNVPQRFAFINPASSEFRKLFVDAMRGIVRDYGPDAVHLDVSAPMWNDGGGLIEGMNYCQGDIQLHRDLLKALPELVLVGESINELLAPYEHFVQRWAWPCSLDPHPVCAFLFDGMVKSYGYLGQPNPDASPESFAEYIRVYEPQGVIPTAVVNSIGDMDADKLGAARWFRVIRTWQDQDLRPDWSTKWPDSMLFSFSGRDGIKAAIERTASSVRMTCGGALIYERLEGVQRVSTLGHIVGHPGFADGEVFGLDPKRPYWVDPGAPDYAAVRVSAIEGDAVIEQSRVTDDLVSFRFVPGVGDVLLDMLDSSGAALTGVLLGGRRTPLERGAVFHRVHASVDGVVRSGIFAHPPWLPGAGQDSNPGGQTWASYSVVLPPLAEGKCALEFSAGIDDKAGDTDGVTFIVRVAGKEAYRRHVTREMPWQEGRIDLSGCAGKDARIELITDAGPAGDTSNDHAVWGEPKVTIERLGPPASARIALKREPAVVVTGEGSARTATRLALAVEGPAGKPVPTPSELAMPCGIYFLYKEPQAISLPVDLIATPFSAGLLMGGMYTIGSAWGGGRTEQLLVNGESMSAINAHPPARGKTVITWPLRLPESPRARLAFTAGVKPNAATEGVAFAVWVNGETRWDMSAVASGWWEGAVDLSDYAGQTIVLELVTDSVGEAVCDWATWVRPRLEPVTN